MFINHLIYLKHFTKIWEPNGEDRTNPALTNHSCHNLISHYLSGTVLARRNLCVKKAEGALGRQEMGFGTWGTEESWLGKVQED